MITGPDPCAVLCILKLKTQDTCN